MFTIIYLRQKLGHIGPIGVCRTNRFFTELRCRKIARVRVKETEISSLCKKSLNNIYLPNTFYSRYLLPEAKAMFDIKRT